MGEKWKNIGEVICTATTSEASAANEEPSEAMLLEETFSNTDMAMGNELEPDMEMSGGIF